MNHLFKRASAAAASAVIALCSLNTLPASFAADTQESNMLTLSFDLSDPDITYDEDDDGNLLKPQSVTNTHTRGVRIPEETPKKKGFTFTGWTVDGIYGYEPGDIFRSTESEVVMKPVFRETGSPQYVLKYEVEMGGEIIDTRLDLPDHKLRENDLYKPSFMSYQDSEKKSTGWTDGEHNFLQEQKLIMPAHDVTLTPIWHRRLTLTYTAGDYDDIVGATSAEFDVIESQPKDIADGSRFSRIGYKIDHWHCDYDDKDYAFLSSFVMPDQNVTMTAVWKPVKYNVVFQTKVTGVSSIKVPGETGTTITVPEMTATKEGYTFGGWTYNGKTYMPGDDFLVEGAMPGMGISLAPVWLAEGETVTTTAPVTTTTAPASTTASSSSESVTTTVSETTMQPTSSAEATTTTSTVSSDATTTTSATTSAPASTSETSVATTTSAGTESETTTTSVTTSKPVSSSETTTTVTTVTSETTKTIPGDANCDGEVSLADAVLIMQSIANPDKYGEKGTDATHITAEGKVNADVTGGGDGITNADALAIQQYMLKIVTKLPVEAAK